MWVKEKPPGDGRGFSGLRNAGERTEKKMMGSGTWEIGREKHRIECPDVLFTLAVSPAYRQTKKK